MTETREPPKKHSSAFRIELNLTSAKPRLDQVLLEALRSQSRSHELKNLSRTAFKDLFTKRKVRIKGQIAKPSSGLAQGTTYVDILGYGEDGVAISDESGQT